MSVSARARLLLLPGILLLLGGCESIGYYVHLSAGQLKLLSDREPVDEVLASLEGRTDAEALALIGRLELSRQVLDHAENHLGLAVGGRYRSFVELNREAVVWNLFAAPELSLTPHSWCYPFVGCAPYRGYFDLDRAEKARLTLIQHGFETHVGPVLAYSTLGWFDDPILSTFIELSEGDFVELLLHELAHSRIWVKGDAGFNESFASFVGRQGTREWFAAKGRLPDYDAYLLEEAAWARARSVLEATRTALEEVYERDATEAEKREDKGRVLDDAAACLQALTVSTGLDGYRRLVPLLNNAYLASLATYRDQIPAFERLFAEAGGDWAGFFRRVDDLSRLDAAARSVRVEALMQSGEQHVAAEGDNHGADEIQCETLAGHGLDAELAR